MADHDGLPSISLGMSDGNLYFKREEEFLFARTVLGSAPVSYSAELGIDLLDPNRSPLGSLKSCLPQYCIEKDGGRA